MLKSKIDELKLFIESSDFLSKSFNDILTSKNNFKLIEDLIFLIGYNYISVERKQGDEFIFKAGMFPSSLEEVLTLKCNIITGSLVDAVQITFNTILDINRQSNILELYPREMRKSINDEIIKKNNIDSNFLNQLNSRLNY
ncbi:MULTISPECIES: hypothetical protein [Vibrio]|jgi:hypothetical protein|uniref:hypothetical protein n=1 Tax=Vibrio TaxID=662 RepID=UPI001BD1D961|nr:MULTISPECIES: hypothetical protein [Vibrio]EJS0325239.1 hypothetical protein [Vibrio alginolyticus]MBS9902876.1 hypothetical protein [Vibrio alginolyticus]MDW1552150.1 hypothetical protein [Vibrio sp. YT-18]